MLHCYRFIDERMLYIMIGVFGHELNSVSIISIRCIKTMTENTHRKIKRPHLSCLITYLLSLASISSTISQSKAASFDVAPNSLLAARAFSTAAALALKRAAEGRPTGTGAKAAEEETRAAIRKSFMVIDMV